MNARTLNAAIFAALFGAINVEVVNVWTAQECPLSSLVLGCFGFSIMIAGLWLVIDNHIKEKDAAKRYRGGVPPKV